MVFSDLYFCTKPIVDLIPMVDPIPMVDLIPMVDPIHRVDIIPRVDHIFLVGLTPTLIPYIQLPLNVVQ